VLITATVLAVPLLAMVFKLGVLDPGSGTDGVNWGPMDFAIVGVLVLGSGLLYEFASARACIRRPQDARRRRRGGVVGLEPHVMGVTMTLPRAWPSSTQRSASTIWVSG
jgi:hypothetical protein